MPRYELYRLEDGVVINPDVDRLMAPPPGHGTRTVPDPPPVDPILARLDAIEAKLDRVKNKVGA